MKAKAQEARAKVIEAEAEVPKPWQKHSVTETWASWIIIG